MDSRRRADGREAARGQHLISTPLDLLYSNEAVLLGLVYGYLPFMVLPLYATIERLDKSFLEASQAFAKRLLSNPADDSARLTQAFRLCVARVPSNHERQQLADLLAVNHQFYKAHPDEAKKLVGNTTVNGFSPDETAAWIATSRILLNLDEFITRE